MIERDDRPQRIAYACAEIKRTLSERIKYDITVFVNEKRLYMTVCNNDEDLTFVITVNTIMTTPEDITLCGYNRDIYADRLFWNFRRALDELFLKW